MQGSFQLISHLGCIGRPALPFMVADPNRPPLGSIPQLFPIDYCSVKKSVAYSCGETEPFPGTSSAITAKIGMEVTDGRRFSGDWITKRACGKILKFLKTFSNNCFEARLSGLAVKQLLETTVG